MAEFPVGEFPIGILSKAKGGISMKMFRVQRELMEKRKQQWCKGSQCRRRTPGGDCRDTSSAARLCSGPFGASEWAGTRLCWQCNAKACSAVSPTTLPMVVSHSTTMPPLCLPHSYYEVACVKKSHFIIRSIKKGGGIFFLCIHGVKTIQICSNGSQHDTVNSHHRVEFVGGN